jgi:UDP-3-O-[3-hydroxymyristoyl] glucosamine N-acyltransferase
MIHPSAVIEDGAVIGERTTVGAFAFIGASVTVGANCIISPGAVIGDDGFGYELQADGSWKFREHLYGVRVEDDVHIGANTIIDRGRRANTIVRRGARIDTLCHIGHHCDIGEDAMLTAGVVLGGSTIVGDRCFIGLNATTKEGVILGAGSAVGMGAVVIRDVPAGELWVGSPARFLRVTEGAVV